MLPRWQDLNRDMWQIGNFGNMGKLVVHCRRITDAPVQAQFIDNHPHDGRIVAHKHAALSFHAACPPRDRRQSRVRAYSRGSTRGEYPPS